MFKTYQELIKLLAASKPGLSNYKKIIYVANISALKAN